MNTTEQSALDTIRQRLIFLHTGDGASPAARDYLAGAVAKLDASVDQIIARQIWDPSNPDHGNAAGRPVSHAEFTYSLPYCGFIEKMVRMWRCPFSRHFQSPDLLERTIAALRFAERFVRPDQPRDGSWYRWDIWFPSVFARQLILLGDHLPADLRARILEDLQEMPTMVFTLDRQRGITRPPIASGMNNLLVLYGGLLRGVALNDPQWLHSVTAQVPIAMGRAPGGEGLQDDWSYHFHGHGVNVGYGLGSLSNQGHWIYLTQGTPWQVPDATRELHVGMIREFFARDMWRGRVAPYSTDRGIVFPRAIYPTSFLVGILYGLASDLPPGDKAVFSAAAADFLQSLDPDGKPVPASVYIEHESELVNGLLLSSVPQPIQADLGVLEGIRYYPASEYLLSRRPGWFAAVRMSSGRTSTWKSQLGANKVGSSTAEFSIALMTDGREFDHTTIPTMNWKRLMGVTRCDAIETPPEGYGQSTFSGGLAGDEFAVLGLQYLLAPAGQDVLRANKSLYVTPDALILLGSLVRCDSPKPVTTTLFHAPLITDSPAPSCHSERSEESRSSRCTGVYLRNGKPLETSQDASWDLKAGETLFLRNVGVRLLTDAQLIIETRRGSHADCNLPEMKPTSTDDQGFNTIYERRWVYLVVNHGVRPTHGRYGAILYPMAAPDQLPAADQFQILHQDDHHRVSLNHDQLGGEVRFPGDWRRKIGLSYWGAEQHQWGSIARWTPADDPRYANLEIVPPRRFVIGWEGANTEIFLPDGFEQENVTLKTYEGRQFPANIISTGANGKVQKLRVRRTGKNQS